MTDDDTQSGPVDFDTAFYELVTLLRRHNATQVVFGLLPIIRETENEKVTEWEGWTLWEVLLLVRWSFEFSGQGVLDLLEPKRDDLVAMVNAVKKVSEAASRWFESDPTLGGMEQWFITASHEQFFLQSNLHMDDIQRQWVFTKQMDSHNSLRRAFVERFGLTPEEFLCFSVMTYALFLKNESQCAVTREQLLENYIGSPDDADRFLALVSADADQIRRYLVGHSENVLRSRALQVREPSPLGRYPFLHAASQHNLYSLRLFGRTFERLFYEVMREDGSGEVQLAFSSMVERYVGLGLAGCYRDIIRERDLEKALPDSSLTDFVLPLTECTVLVEVKAVDLHPLAKVMPTPDHLSQMLESSVVKAIYQGLAVANELQQEGILDIPNRSRFFLLVVTLEDMHLGPVYRAWDQYLKAVIEPMLAKKGYDSSAIPLHRMMILSIQEFDRLMSVLAQGSLTLPEILEQVEQSLREEQWPDGKASFGQHLRDYPTDTPPHLDGAFGELQEKAREMYRR